MLILDSGAFTAWTKQTKIDIEQYTKFCLDNQECFDVIVALDVIPGKWGQKYITYEEREQAAEEGWENYIYMRESGVDPDKLMHIFHMGDEFKWLDKIVKEMDYIGLSPANDKQTKAKVQWLDKCMSYVINKDGYPKVKFHGFAVTALPIMFRYPWYSVDSTMWCQWAGYGLLAIPPLQNGRFNYRTTPIPLSITERSGQSGIVKERVHIDNWPPKRRQMVFDLIEEKGFDFEKLKHDYKMRYGWNLAYFREVEKHSDSWPPKTKTKWTKAGFGL